MLTGEQNPNPGPDDGTDGDYTIHDGNHETGPLKPTSLEQAVSRLRTLNAELESWTRRAEEQPFEERERLLESIKRTEARIDILSRNVPVVPPNTCQDEGECVVCRDQAKPFLGCTHASSGILCEPCFGSILKSDPIRGEDDFLRRVTFPAIRCPLCRDPIAMTDNALKEVTRFLIDSEERRKIRERERLEDQASAVEYERRMLSRRRREEAHRQAIVQQEENGMDSNEIRQRQQAEKDDIDRRNEQLRRIVHNQALEREEIRSMIGRGEELPPDTILFPRLDVDPIHFCSNGCHIPKQNVGSRHYIVGLEPDVVVTHRTRCDDCRQLLIYAWTVEAMLSHRAVDFHSAEEHQRLDELYDDAFNGLM